MIREAGHTFYPLTVGPVYIRSFFFFTSNLLNVLTIKWDINQQDLKIVASTLSNLNNFHSLEAVDRVSGDNMSENSNRITWWLKQYFHVKCLDSILHLKLQCHNVTS